MRSGRGDKRLWQRCRVLVDDLDLPTPFDTARFGPLVTTDRADRILYPADTTPLHQQHIQLHEIAHLLCGHHETSAAASSAAQVLLPHLPAALVQRVLGRTVYTEPQEEEAEPVASLILNRAAQLDRAAEG
ncbi:ParH-like protein [Streptomyces sp. NPDC013157]|uniref:ParH-like protein n=1 Tax=Streptomyces sp. NPDC013157 TaxID=3364861 RepID=UPI0036A87616